MVKEREYCYISIHDEVKIALHEWTKENGVDIAFVPFLRFLISYAHTNHIRSDYDAVAADSIYWLDTSNLTASDQLTDGRIRERIQTTSSLIINMSEDERYTSLICGLHALDITIEDLAI